MTKSALCCCAVFSTLVASCAPTGRPELPADQATKIRQHRTLPSEDIEETARAKEGSPLPATSEGSWKF